MKIDAHQHFWRYNPVRDSWITPEMSAIRQDFLPGDLWKELSAVGINGSIAVQANQSEEENEFLLSLASQNDFIKGIVGWVDLRSASIAERLAYYAGETKMKGFRHVLQGEEDRGLMLHPAFMNGISQLNAFGFTYDILIFPDQLRFVPELVSAFPQQKFVIDHLAKPDIKRGDIEVWQKLMKLVAEHPNVYCKVSGMVTEADWQHWKPSDLLPYLDAVWEAFGSERLMFGSDYPVCLVAGGYQKWVAVLKEYTSKLSVDEQAGFWGRNAIGFYNIGN